MQVNEDRESFFWRFGIRGIDADRNFTSGLEDRDAFLFDFDTFH